jgi:hypothetical protein
MRAIAGNVPTDIKVYFDGKEVAIDCTAADDQEGWVDLVIRDEQGKIIWADKELPIAKIERLYGKVEIVLPPDFEWMRNEPVAPESHALNHSTGE